MKIARSSAQRQLRLLLACSGAAVGGTWGCVALALADDPRTGAVLAGQAALGDVGVVVALLVAIPVGALCAAFPMDLVSHAVGRRPAMLVCSCLVILGSLVGVAPATWTQVLAGVVSGLGAGGFAIVTPKVAHEMAERGHRRLIPRLVASLPAGAGVALVCGEAGALVSDSRQIATGWLAPVILSVLVVLLSLGLPETPHWYVAHGKVEAGYAALRRMSDPLEAAVAIDWVMMDAGMLGAQSRLSYRDLRVERVRRTVVVQALLELIQVLPLGLASICLAPTFISRSLSGDAAGGATGGSAVGPAGGAAGTAPLWAVALLAATWMGAAVVSRRRRPEQMLLAWVLAGTGLASCGVLLMMLGSRVHGTGAVWLYLVVAAILVVAQYVCVAPACTGGTDPLVPPWLLRSQRRAQAVARPLVQIASVVAPVVMLAAGVRGEVVAAVCLGLQVAALLLVLLTLPRLSAALR